MNFGIYLLMSLSLISSLFKSEITNQQYFSKTVKYNEELINQGFMALEHFYISDGHQQIYSSYEEELKAPHEDKEPEETKEEEDIPEIHDENNDYFLTIYGKKDNIDDWTFLSECFVSIENFNIRHYPKQEAETMDVSHLESNDSFDITLTNNLIFKFIVSPLVYHIKLEFSQNDCLTPFVFYDDSNDTEITFDEKLNMLHILHEEGHSNYYLEEIRNYSDLRHSRVFYMKNPYFSTKENIYLNIICPFWKYSEVNKIRGKGSFKFWNNLQIYHGKSNQVN
jgi:hypothetical protein